ncbi:hypothetical protein IKG31_01860 [Candidatus Saccharibacteria bacterium]|nr:hypothetical protein [Candidatus Saccharibacteria bacterium]
MDLATEGQNKIIEKCRRYHEYYQTNREQQATSVFPLIVWIVPTVERKERMTGNIKKAFLKGYARIFLVITPEELTHCTLGWGKEGGIVLVRKAPQGGAETC